MSATNLTERKYEESQSQTDGPSVSCRQNDEKENISSQKFNKNSWNIHSSVLGV